MNHSVELAIYSFTIYDCEEELIFMMGRFRKKNEFVM